MVCNMYTLLSERFQNAWYSYIIEVRLVFGNALILFSIAYYYRYILEELYHGFFITVYILNPNIYPFCRNNRRTCKQQSLWERK
jgi:hypothetical protein